MSKLSRVNRIRILFAVILVFGVFLDQITKYLAVSCLPRPTLPLIKGVLHLTYAENPGAAFGILKDHPWVFMVFSTVAIVAVAVYLLRGVSYLSERGEDGRYPPISLLSAISLSLIATGGVGNMIDRVAYGYVVDFIDFRWINFAIFNVADSFVTVGAILLIVELVRTIFLEKKQKNKENG